MKKKFLYKDKSGRGFTNTFDLAGLKKAFKGERSWDDELASTWAKDAEAGDRWENAANEITCFTEKKVMYEGKKVGAISFGSI
jgi:hypothetical protein